MLWEREGLEGAGGGEGTGSAGRVTGAERKHVSRDREGRVAMCLGNEMAECQMGLENKLGP